MQAKIKTDQSTQPTTLNPLLMIFVLKKRPFENHQGVQVFEHQLPVFLSLVPLRYMFFPFTTTQWQFVWLSRCWTKRLHFGVNNVTCGVGKTFQNNVMGAWTAESD